MACSGTAFYTQYWFISLKMQIKGRHPFYKGNDERLVTRRKDDYYFLRIVEKTLSETEKHIYFAIYLNPLTKDSNVEINVRRNCVCKYRHRNESQK
jgi:hypothetical protein